MEFGVREWMILIGGLLILAVIADGVRRMIRERRDGIRMSLNPRHHRRNEDHDYTSELPSGGARVLPRENLQGQPDDDTSPDSHDLAMESFAADERVGDAPREDEPAAEQPAAEPLPPRPARAERSARASAKANKPAAKSAPQAGQSPEADFDEVLVMHVLARGDDGFSGASLLELLLACDLRFGDLDIFHRHEQARGRGPVQFSVANLVKPGSFDLREMKEFHTPGVSLFMRLPGPAKPMEALDCMVETARSIARNLDGEMRDEGRSVLTPQTLEHYRQRVRDFERRRLAGTV